MAEIVGSLYLISTAGFAVMALFVGTRLLLLWRRTRQTAELVLGLGLILTAALGYGVMMVGIVGRSMAEIPSGVPSVYGQITIVGWIFHNIGVVCMLCFVVKVFRPGVLWARALATISTAVLWAGWIAYVADGGINATTPNGYYWIAFSVIGSYPIWIGIESFLFWGRMRKRLALGIANALVTNRFLLWGIASISAAGSIWVVNLPTLLGYAPGTPGSQTATIFSMLITSLLGMTTLSFYWLTFFPPVWYRTRFRSSGPEKGDAPLAADLL